MKHCLLAFLLLFSFWAWAQPKVITVDTTTGVPMETPPFHRPFFLKMLARNAKPVKVYLFQHIRNRALGSTLLRKTIKVTSRETDDGRMRTDTTFETFFPKKLDPSYYFTKKEGDKLYLYIALQDTNALQPSRQYSLAVYYATAPGTTKVFKLLHSADSLGSGQDVTIRRKRAKLISELINENYNQIAVAASLQETVFFGMRPLDYPTSKQLDTTKITDIQTNGVVTTNYAWKQRSSGKMLAKPASVSAVNKLVTYYEQQVRPVYQKIDTQNNILIANVRTQSAALVGSPVKIALNDINGLFIRYDAIEDGKIRELFIQDNNRMLRVIQRIGSLTGTSYLPVGDGSQPLICDFCKIATAYSARISNLESTIGDLEKLRLIAGLLINQTVTIAPLIAHLDVLVNQLKTNRTELKKTAEDAEESEKLIGKSDQFNTADIATANTFIFNFETRTKFNLVPEVGFLTNRGFKNGTSSNFLLVPYVGATINFTQLDRDVPFYLIRNKTFWTRTGLIVGYSLVSLKDSTATPPRDDFFAKSSLVTGFSFRFSNTVKAVFGYTWFYKRALDTGQRNLTSLPFIGVSFDLDIKKYVTGIFEAVTSLKGPAAPTPKSTEVP